MTRASLYEFIRAHDLAVLGTISGEQQPQAALVGIAVNPELEIIFDTVKSSRKYRNLSADRSCSFVVGWTNETTLQYEGQAEELAGDPLKRYKKTYFQKFPDGPEREKWPGIVYFVVRPKWIRYSDYQKVPPHIQEFTF